MNWQILLIVLILPAYNLYKSIMDEPSVARLWNEALLNSIRMDYARPTVHARNLFHTSIAMYDAWALFDDTAETYLIGKTVGGFSCPFTAPGTPDDLHTVREEVISYAMYRILRHRFRTSPGARKSLAQYNNLMKGLGYDNVLTSTDYSSGSPASLGNYIGQCVIDFGLQDGANEKNGYENRHYKPVNPPLDMTLLGNPKIVDHNRWQPLSFEVFIDQSGNVFKGATPEFVGPEWGEVFPFSLKQTDLRIYERDGYKYRVYHDPGPPPYMSINQDLGSSEQYKWGFAMVSIWSSHLDPADNVMWDISPASIGNIRDLPLTIEEYQDFYDFLNGGDTGKGHAVNPHTGQPYEPQLVPRGDYVRALAEFWADGPDSETPPGHWFTILNYVNEHPEFEKRFRGQGPVLDNLEWDVKSYFVLGGAVHDAAIAAWGIKGWYDYIRPVLSIRAMAERGQSSDPKLTGYHPAGIPLHEGFIEVVQEGNPLAGENGEHTGKIKLYAWRGPEQIKNPDTDAAGVGSWFGGRIIKSRLTS